MTEFVAIDNPPFMGGSSIGVSGFQASTAIGLQHIHLPPPVLHWQGFNRFLTDSAGKIYIKKRVQSPFTLLDDFAAQLTHSVNAEARYSHHSTHSTHQLQPPYHGRL